MSRTVLVTGASGGIGRAVAAAFARNGDAVALGCHSRQKEAQALCTALEADGARAMVCAADVADSAQVDGMFSQVERAFGEVEVLVCCAGWAQQKLACDITDDDWQRMMAVNVTGTFWCSRRAMPAMIRKKSGSIIHLSSMWGQVGASCEVHYSAAKAAVIGLTRALAKEVGPSGVRVNCIAPGAVDAGMMDGFSEADKTALCEEIPLGRLGTAREIAETALFLASEAAAYFTGQVLAPNGGMVL